MYNFYIILFYSPKRRTRFSARRDMYILHGAYIAFAWKQKQVNRHTRYTCMLTANLYILRFILYLAAPTVFRNNLFLRNLLEK